MNKTNIEWVKNFDGSQGYVWNPVWGCKNNCEYCYARKINNRFKKIENWNKPEWLESNFQKSFPKKPSRIFVNSMSDIAFWKPEWMEKVLNKIKEYPQHTFLFLTKDFDIYADWEWPTNCWLGYTITNQSKMNDFCLGEAYFPENNKLFLSIEPIQNKIDLFILPDWIIIGAETGNRKNKIIPQKEWIEEFIQPDVTIPIFMKNNLKPYWNGKFKQEFPD